MTLVQYRVDFINYLPHPLARVVATLIGPTLTQVSTVDRQTMTRADMLGNWSLRLRPNSDFSSYESYYELAIGSHEVYRCIVPDSPTPVLLKDIITTAPPLNPIPVLVTEQNFTEQQQLLVQHNLGLGSAAGQELSAFALRGDSNKVVFQEGADYPQPPGGFATYTYYGTKDPQTQIGLPVPRGSAWISGNFE